MPNSLYVFASAILILLAQRTPSCGAVITNATGNFTVSGGYANEAGGSDFPLQTTPVDLTVAGANSLILLVADGSFSASALSVSSTISLNSKLSVEGTNSSSSRSWVSSATMTSRGGFLVQYAPSDFGPDGRPLPLLKTTFSWALLGEVAPGDTVFFHLENSVFQGPALNAVLDTAGNRLQYQREFMFTNTTPDALPIDFAETYVSAPWEGSSQLHFGFLSTAQVRWFVKHEPGSSGKSWVGFSDPGTLTEIITPSITGVPEPASLLVWGMASLLGFASTRLIRRQRAHED